MINVYLYGMTIHRIKFESKCQRMLQHFCKGKSAEVHIDYLLDLRAKDSGGCYENDGDIYIEAQSDIALAHELVHAVQIINGKLDLAKQTWNGECFKDSSNPPWEKQAYRLEQKILNNFLLNS